MDPSFFPFDPRPTRRALFGGACLLAVLTAWALAAARAGEEPLAGVRAGVCAALLALFLATWHRLRPRAGWGVRLDGRGLTVSRPLSGRALRVAWFDVATVRRTGRRGEVLGLFLRERRPVMLARHLFADRKAYEALARTLEERVPSPGYDA